MNSVGSGWVNCTVQLFRREKLHLERSCLLIGGGSQSFPSGEQFKDWVSRYAQGN